MFEDLDARPRLTRRRALGALFAVAGTSLLAACGPAVSTPSPTVPPAAKPTAAPAAPTQAPPKPAATVAATSAPAATQPAVKPAAAAPQPKSGGTLRVGMVGDIARVDGHLLSTGNVSWAPFDRLIEYDQNSKPNPMLAESWELNSDSSQIKLNLRKGATWHSGREFTSDDVKWNLLWVRDPKIASGALVGQSNWFTSIETPDKNTLVLKSDQPRPAMFDFFEVFNIIDPTVAEGPDAASKVGGTGAFSWAEWSPGERIRLAKHKNYWATGKPYLDEVIVTIFRDAQGMVASLEAGAIDVADNPSIQDLTRLTRDSKYRAFTTPWTTTLIGFNTTREPTNAKALRQAFQYALDRKRICEVVFEGTAKPTSIPWVAGSEAYDDKKAAFYTYEIDRAKSILQSAGIGPMSLPINASTASPDQALIAQIFGADLQKLGITLQIRPLDQGQYLNEQNNRLYNGMYVGTTAYQTLEPVSSMNASRHLDSSGNSNTGFTSDQYRSLHATASVEPDAAKRKALYSQITDLIIDESFIMPIGSVPVRMVARAAVNDIFPSRHGALMYNSAWLA
jgi:peptide/nickel transport system substrate-binding protein